LRLPSEMRLPDLAPLTRRSVLTVCTLSVLSCQRPLVQPARARVDGIPLYAPGDQVVLPPAGFETYLPQLEDIRDVQLPALRAAIEAAEWDAARVGADAKAAQLVVLSKTASILGDEAYTAVSLKGRYSTAAAAVQSGLSSKPAADQLLTGVAVMESTLREFIALIPDSVVEAVRARDDKLRALQAPPAPAPKPEPVPEPAPSVGMLMTPTRGPQVCGKDIRC
jgi:hypothetical protein